MPKREHKHSHHKQAQNTKKKDVNSAYIARSWWVRKEVLIMAFFLIIANLLVFYSSTGYDFVQWDDDMNVYDNPYVQRLTGDNVKNIFTTSVIGGYNPLSILTFALEIHFIGSDPSVHHTTNLILHILNTLLVFWLLSLLGLSPWASLFAALLFAVHPMRVESVVWITERKDVLFTFFYLISLILYLFYLNKKQKKYLLIALLVFCLSLFSKIQAVSLPLAMLAIDYLYKRKISWGLVLEKVPFFAMSLIVGIIGILFLTEQESLDVETYNILDKILIGFYSISVYLVKSVVPYQHSALYPYPQPGKLSFWYYLSPLFLALLTYLIYKTTKKTRQYAFGLMFFFVNIVFLLQVVGAGQGFIADRFTYVAYIGLFYIFAVLFEKVSSMKPTYKTAAFALSGVLILILGYSAHSRTKTWENSETLWNDVIKKYRNVAVAHNNRAKYYREHGQIDKALLDYQELIRIKPNDHNAYVSRGRLYFESGQYKEAMTDFNKAIELNPGSPLAFSNRGTLNAMQKNYEPALKDLTRAIELNPRLTDAYSNRILLFFELQQYERAIEDCNTYLELLPYDDEIINLRGVCWATLKQNDKAMIDYNRSIQLNPRTSNYYLNRSLLFKAMGNNQSALADAQRAQQMGMKVDPTYINGLK